MTAAFSLWKRLERNCGVSQLCCSALGLCMIWLVNFYKSSSARQRKTRPVAILSTTLQPYFRFHLNATCAVCAGPHGQVDRGKQIVWNDSGSIFFPPRWLLTCRCSWNRIGSIWAISAGGISLFWRIRQEGEGKGRAGGMYVLSFLALNVPQKSKMWWAGPAYSGVLRCYRTIPASAPIQKPPNTVLSPKLRASARKTSPLELLHGQTRKPFSLRITQRHRAAQKSSAGLR